MKKGLKITLIVLFSLIPIVVTACFFGVVYTHPNLPVSLNYFAFVDNFSIAALVSTYGGAFTLYVSVVLAFLKIILVLKAFKKKPLKPVESSGIVFYRYNKDIIGFKPKKQVFVVKIKTHTNEPYKAVREVFNKLGEYLR